MVYCKSKTKPENKQNQGLLARVLLNQQLITLQKQNQPKYKRYTMKFSCTVTFLMGGALCRGDSIRGVAVCIVMPRAAYVLNQRHILLTCCFGVFSWTKQQRQLQDAIVVAQNDTFSLVESSGRTFLGNVLDNDITNEFAILPMSVTLFSNTELGTLEVSEDGNVDYTPPEDFVGIEEFDYTVCDTSFVPICDTAVVIINITEFRPIVPPTAVDDAFTMREGEMLEVDSILDNDLTVDSLSLFVCKSSRV
jgi:Bacterial Ig domain